ncbi:MAG: ABC transporter permease [Deltaproteobacteria bacterium]
MERLGSYTSPLSSVGPAGRLLRYSSCLWLLVSRSLKVRYRRSVLGFAWSLAYPLASMAVLTVVFSSVFPDLPHYSLYVVVGVLVWGFFSLSCLQAMDSLISGAPVLRKVYVPAVVFPLSVVGANLANLLLSLCVLPVVVWATGAQPGLHLLWLAGAVVALLSFTAGLCLALAAVNLIFNDVRYFFEGILLVWFYATPIVYPVDVIPDHLSVFLWLNPLFWILEFIRAPLYGGSAPAGIFVVASLGLGFSVLAGGWALFVRLERRFHLYL